MINNLCCCVCGGVGEYLIAVGLIALGGAIARRIKRRRDHVQENEGILKCFNG